MKKFLLSILLLATVILLSNCNKNETDYYNESKIVNNFPDLSVYKTSGDYIDFLHIRVDSNDVVTMFPAYAANSTRINIDKDGKAHQNFRFKLKSGYIVSNEGNVNLTYTDITIQEYFDYVEKNGEDIPASLFKQRIIDRDPYTEYYNLNGLNAEYKEFTLEEINKLAENNKLETIFTKLK